MSIPQRLSLAIIAVLTLGAVSCGKSGVRAAGENTDLTDQKIISLEDQKFLSRAEETEIRQLSLAQVALQRARDVKVLEFAKRVADERTQAWSGLKRLMADKQFQGPPGKAEVTRLEATNRLRSIPDDAVDHEFVSLMAAEQQDAVTNFDAAAQTSPDPDIRSYAGSILPSLRTDYAAAAALENNLGSPAGRFPN